MVVGGAELGYFFHHLLLLVNLDGKNTPVRAGVVQTFDRLAERFVDIGNTGIQNIFHAQQHGHIVAALFKPGDNLWYRNLRPLGPLRTNHNLARIRHVKIPGTPITDAVKLDGILHPPLLQCAVFCQFLLLLRRWRICMVAWAQNAGR